MAEKPKRVSSESPQSPQGPKAAAPMPLRRRVIQLGAAGVVSSTALVVRHGSATPNERLHVFVQSSLRTRALQNTLLEALPGVEVVVYVRHRDFARSMARNPTAMLAIAPVLLGQGLEPELFGYNGNAKTEPYSLLGLDTPPSPGTVKTVGMVDLLGRRATATFVANLLGGQRRVKPVIKTADLLPLLLFGNVDGVILPTRLLPFLRSKSRRSLRSIELTRHVSLPAVASPGGNGHRLLADIRKLRLDVNKKLGVSVWK